MYSVNGGICFRHECAEKVGSVEGYRDGSHSFNACKPGVGVGRLRDVVACRGSASAFCFSTLFKENALAVVMHILSRFDTHDVDTFAM